MWDAQVAHGLAGLRLGSVRLLLVPLVLRLLTESLQNGRVVIGDLLRLILVGAFFDLEIRIRELSAMPSRGLFPRFLPGAKTVHHLAEVQGGKGEVKEASLRIFIHRQNHLARMKAYIKEKMHH